ncbi:hypothetical protein ACA910_005760 [Epithemia clementina (nom. ined.)]
MMVLYICALSILTTTVAFQSAFHFGSSPALLATSSPGLPRTPPFSSNKSLAIESQRRRAHIGAATDAVGESTKADIATVEAGMKELKRTLEREYASFFSPMERDFYAESVTFDDPMTSLEGIDSYERNVDMLSGKNIVGKILFRDAGIVLHNIKGGEIIQTANKITIEDLITRWTLRLTFQALPWQPTARFSGISVYKVGPGGPKGVQVLKQTDYWDSINLVPNNKGGAKEAYQKVPTSKAFSDFLNQLKPSQNFAAPSAGTEMPYQLLRRGVDYEVRRYPSFVAVRTQYERRDLGFSELGAFASGLKPLAPAIMNIVDKDNDSKFMMWPLGYAPPGSDAPPADVTSAAKAKKEQQAELYGNCEVVVVPERVIAVGTFADASVEPVVRATDRRLREACQRDGLAVASADDDTSGLTFAQYDAIFSMGERRGEVWIELKEGQHSWSKNS